MIPMVEGYRGGRTKEKDWAGKDQQVLNRRPGTRPEIRDKISEPKDVAFLEEVRDSINFALVKSIVETMLAKSDVSDPHIKGYPDLFRRFDQQTIAYSPELDLTVFNPDEILKISGDLLSRDSKMHEYTHRIRTILGLNRKASMRERWRKDESYKLFVLYYFFHELMHSFSKIRLSKNERLLESGYMGLSGKTYFGEGANDLAALVLFCRYARAEGLIGTTRNGLKMISRVIHFSPRLLNDYILLLFAKEIAQHDIDPTRVTDALIRGHFNEGNTVLSENMLEGLPMKKARRVLYMSSTAEMLSILKEEFGVTGTNEEIWNRARKEIEAYVEASSHTSLHADRYASPAEKPKSKAE
jgi:hypothetical protein